MKKPAQWGKADHHEPYHRRHFDTAPASRMLPGGVPELRCDYRRLCVSDGLPPHGKRLRLDEER
jgi:hypothetical protein